MVYPGRDRPVQVQEPYAPKAGEDDLPALRYIIFADLTHQIQHIDESADTIQGFWESPSINRIELSQQTAVWSMTTLLLYYTAQEDYSLGISVTGDGGRIWQEESTWTLLASRGGIRNSLKGVNVTGFDLRFRLIFREAQPISIHAYRPKLIPRGTLTKAGR